MIYSKWCLYSSHVCPQNDPHWGLRAYTKWSLQHVFPRVYSEMHGTFTAEKFVYCDGASTIWRKLVTMMNFLFQYYVFYGSYMYVRKSIFQMLSRSSEKIIALGALLWMSPRLGLRNSLGRFGAGLPPRPRTIPSQAACTGTAGLPRPVGGPVREAACFADRYLCTRSSWRQKHPWGGIEI